MQNCFNCKYIPRIGATVIKAKVFKYRQLSFAYTFFPKKCNIFVFETKSMLSLQKVLRNALS
jgi:hypothetical protein